MESNLELLSIFDTRQRRFDDIFLHVTHGYDTKKYEEFSKLNLRKYGGDTNVIF